jgi:hypothetical protein
MTDFKRVEAGQPAEEWLGLMGLARKREQDWRNQAHEALSRYRDERPSETNLQSRKSRKFNILWANTEVLMSHLCTDLGTPDVRRQFTQPGKKTRIAKLAAEVLEKAMTVEAHGYDIAHEFENAIQDHLLPGRGVCWLELNGTANEDGEFNWLDALVVHVPWDRFLHGPGDHWNEIPWVARELPFTREDLKDQFEKYADDVPLENISDVGAQNKKRSLSGEDTTSALVYEVWCKENGQRFYIADGFDKILKADDDPYRLKHFFPCPRPLYALKQIDGMEPTPLYWMYADQAAMLDRLTTREYRLSEALKYCGVYGSLGDDQLPNMGDLDDGQFVPMKNFAILQEKGGIANMFMVRDLAPIQVALAAVTEKKTGIIQDIYQLTGISDIIRGQTNPNETFGAQELKARFGSNRSARWQRRVQRFVRDSYRLKAELIAEHYSRNQLQEMTGILMPTREEQAQAKKALEQAQQMQKDAAQRQEAIVKQAMQPPAPPQGMPPGMPGAMPPQGAPMPQQAPQGLAA